MADTPIVQYPDASGNRAYAKTHVQAIDGLDDKLAPFAKTDDLNGYLKSGDKSRSMLNIIEFGAKAGDKSFDNAPIINNLLNAMPAKGGTIYIPVGDFWINTPIIINNNYVRIVGENSGFRSNIDPDPNNTNRPGGGSKLCLTPTNPNGLILGATNQGDRLSGIEFDNLNIVGAAAIGKQVSQTGIYLNRNSDGVKIQNNVIMNLDYGVVAVGTDALRVNNNWICELTNGVHVLGSSQQCQVQNNYIGCQPKGISLKFDSPFGATISNNNIYPDGFENLEINNGTIVNITGNNFQSFYTGAIKLSGNNMSFQGNMVYIRENNGNWSTDPINRDGKYGAIHVDGDDNTFVGNHLISEQPVDDTRILIMSGNNNKLSSNKIGGNASKNKIVINGSCNNTMSIYNCADNEFDSGGNPTNISISNSDFSPDLSSYAKKTDLGIYAKKTDIVGNNQAKSTISNGDLSIMKFKSMGITDYTPQTDPSYNQEHHLENPAGFMNDMQSIFQDRNGLWHVYYLNEPTWGINNETGSSNWQHATSKDGTHWVNDSDIAIKSRKLDTTVNWGSVATGSVVISDGSIMGTNDGDFVAYFSSYGASNSGGQSIWAGVSKDNGHSYQPLYDSAVMPNSANYPNFRDPYVTKYNGKWVMYTAEGDKVGTYSSTDGKSWSYIGSTLWNSGAFSDGKDHGVIECPYVVTMVADDGTSHVVQFVGANDYKLGYTTGTSYLIGSIDSNGIFSKQNDQTLPVRVDLGTDYYGSNFGKVDDRTLITGSWVNNWAYANEKVIGIDGNQTKKGTTCALFRDIKMVKDDSAPSGYSLQVFVRDVVDRTFPTNDDYNVYHDIPSGGEYLKTIKNSKVVDFDIKGGQPGGMFVIDVRQDDNVSTLMFDINGGWVRTKRSLNGNFNNSDYNDETKNITYGKSGLTDTHLTVYFDIKSIEIEFTDSHQVYTLLKWGKRTNPVTTLSLQGGNMPVSVNCKEYDYK